MATNFSPSGSYVLNKFPSISQWSDTGPSWPSCLLSVTYSDENGSGFFYSLNTCIFLPDLCGSYSSVFESETIHYNATNKTKLIKKICFLYVMMNIWFCCIKRSDESEEEVVEKKELEEEEKPDPLKQLITCLSRAATKEQQSSMPEDDIYISYAQIMSQVNTQMKF